MKQKFTKTEFRTPVYFITFILVMMAAWVDVIGLKLSLDERSAYMTGRAALLGEAFHTGDYYTFLIVALIVFMFIFGSFLATKICLKHGFSGGLLTSSVILALGSLSLFVTNANNEKTKVLACVLVPMAMGCLNATTSLSKIGRTTHLTGPATDLGISLGKGNWHSAFVHSIRWVAFPVGAVLGLTALQYNKQGSFPLAVMLFIPSLVIALIAVLQKKYLDIKLLSDG